MDVLALVGATATGKSEAALALAEKLGGELVNADALQVYRGLDVGTAKPSAEERRRTPHHLLDVLEPTEPFSAGEFARRARAVIDQILERGRLPIVVGGSGLYLRALFDGLAELPSPDPRVRSGLRSRLEREGLEPLARQLEAVDPRSRSRIARGDPQRTLRALEVWYQTGLPLSWWQRCARTEPAGWSVTKVGLTMERALLYDRIDLRVRSMIERGWVDEVRNLLFSGVPSSAPAFQAIGYRQLVAHLQGRCGLSDAVSEITAATRRYAKRQETWFRKEPGVQWVRAGEAASETLLLLRGRGEHFMGYGGVE
ncbi:MAG TPA: tRNA (adenosine(37)-N6)-dimethylallyltransferase MiaA [Thermoanaerobaculia bacterium]|nr:tRNA (adenosine(37)-N6)-dimethylallyltransferase MiaA [Thermoanaerobaculia bacterium]